MKANYPILLSALLFAPPTLADEVTIDVLSTVLPPPIGNDVYSSPLPSVFDVTMTFDSLTGTSSVSAIPNNPYIQGVQFSGLVLQSWSVSADGTLLASGNAGTVSGYFAPMGTMGGFYDYNLGFTQGSNSFGIFGDLAGPGTLASLANDPVGSFFSQIPASSWFVQGSQASGEWGTLQGSQANTEGADHVIVTIQPSVSVPEPPLLPLMALGLASVFLGVRGRARLHS
jgi:hypothetical protein